jgi:hypothetical protein
VTILIWIRSSLDPDECVLQCGSPDCRFSTTALAKLLPTRTPDRTGFSTEAEILFFWNFRTALKQTGDFHSGHSGDASGEGLHLIRQFVVHAT